MCIEFCTWTTTWNDQLRPANGKNREREIWHEKKEGEREMERRASHSMGRSTDINSHLMLEKFVQRFCFEFKCFDSNSTDLRRWRARLCVWRRAHMRAQHCWLFRFVIELNWSSVEWWKKKRDATNHKYLSMAIIYFACAKMITVDHSQSIDACQLKN